MYAPAIGRWLSEDPAGYVDGPNQYVYVRNNSVNWTDPSGWQAQNQDDVSQCCACRMAIHDAGNPKRIQAISNSVKRRTCVVQLYCAQHCPNDLLGATIPAMPLPGINEVSIAVCISCRLADASVQAVIDHEMVHATRFCNTPSGGITDCNSCKIQERKAYEASCSVAYPNDRPARIRCVKCGEALGCAHLRSATGGPCTQVGDCKVSDLGISLKPD